MHVHNLNLQIQRIHIKYKYTENFLKPTFHPWYSLDLKQLRVRLQFLSNGNYHPHMFDRIRLHIFC